MIYQTINPYFSAWMAQKEVLSIIDYPITDELCKFVNFIYVYSNGMIVDKLFTKVQFLKSVADNRESTVSYIVYSYDYDNQYNFGLFDEVDLNENMWRMWKVLGLIKNTNIDVHDHIIATCATITSNGNKRVLHSIYGYLDELNLLYELFFAKNLNNPSNQIYSSNNAISEVYGVGCIPLYAICISMFHDIMLNLLYKNIKNLENGPDFYKIIGVFFLDNLVDNFPNERDRLEQSKQHLSLKRLVSPRL